MSQCWSIINSTYGANALVLFQMNTESAQTTCIHCYNFKHLQTPVGSQLGRPSSEMST